MAGHQTSCAQWQPIASQIRLCPADFAALSSGVVQARELPTHPFWRVGAGRHRQRRKMRGTHDPMRQADIKRRLANLARAQRCGARTRVGYRCKQTAVRARCWNARRSKGLRRPPCHALARAVAGRMAVQTTRMRQRLARFREYCRRPGRRIGDRDTRAGSRSLTIRPAPRAGRRCVH
jgi:hypothetical protein